MHNSSQHFYIILPPLIIWADGKATRDRVSKLCLLPKLHQPNWLQEVGCQSCVSYPNYSNQTDCRRWGVKVVFATQTTATKLTAGGGVSKLCQLPKLQQPNWLQEMECQSCVCYPNYSNQTDCRRWGIKVMSATQTTATKLTAGGGVSKLCQLPKLQQPNWLQEVRCQSIPFG